MSETVHEQLQLSLYMAEHASYASLDIVDQVYPHWVISYVVCGDVITSCCGESWRARAGDVMIHPPQLPFSEQAAGPGTHQWLLLDAVTSRHIDLFRLYPVSPVISLRATTSFSAVFGRLLTCWTDISLPFRHIQISAYTLQLCSIVLEAWQQQGSPPRPAALLTPSDRFTDVIGYMSQHLEQKLTRDDLAALVYLHPGYFDRAFRSIYGVSPMQMLRDLRLQQAQRLLETTNLSLHAIALQCGLGDAGYFSRVFRQYYGQPPGNYRESAKSAKESYMRPL
ncbi:helix-turn-helix domain-containing protein [Dictyobacter formicarum]|uniref:HTH araC/xylS-type domain-containing protein n=1 Tax=Dictyobacter formicarum TaxID=2778368 RepID=A0ABQ3VNR2_9CHLR|nr:AraC family transcriptional regulator [Dictyobacter formicarum]GHO87882.1 hypothetical protein KSZ_58880 [Dictyobacter formicarum]